MRYLHIVVIAILVSVTGAMGQESVSIPNWELTTYQDNRSDDFSDNKYIIKDSLGYLWTSNPSSIERFDGKNFKIYYTFDDFNEDNDVRYVHRLYCGRDGTVYALSATGLHRYNRSKDKFEPMMDGFVPYKKDQLPEFTSMVDQDSILYISSFVGLYAYHRNSEHWQFFDLTPQFEHENAHHSPKVIWFILQDKYQPNIIHIFGKSVYHEFDVASHSIVKSFQLTERNLLSIHKAIQIAPDEFYLATFGLGVVQLNTSQRASQVFYNESSIYIGGMPYRTTHSAQFVDDFFVATSMEDEVAFIDTATHEVIKWKNLGDSQHDFVSFGEDRYWCTMFKGLIKLENTDHQFWQSVTPAGHRMMKIWPNREETIVGIFTEKYYLLFYDFARKKSIVLDGIERCRNLHYDAYTNEYMVETDVGNLRVYDANDLSFKRKITIRNNFEYLDFKITDKHWIINQIGRLALFDKEGNELSHVDIPKEYYTYFQLNASWISPMGNNRYILQNPAHVVVADLNKGTYTYHLELKNQGFLGSYTLDGENIFTVKSRHGLLKYKYIAEEERFYPEHLEYNVDPFTPYAHVGFQDSLIWMRGRGGFKVFNIKTERFVKDKNYRITNYSYYNDLTATSSGVWLPGTNEMIKVDPPSRKSVIESLNLESIQVEDNQYELTDFIEFPPQTSSIKLSWSAPFYTGDEKVNFYTRLEGRYDEWESLGETTEKVYLGLDPGTYIFQVKAVANGAEIVEKNLLRFEILPPWWATWWFRALNILGFCGLLYLFYRFRVNELTKKNNLEKKIATLELKALKAQLNPHFIFNSLNSIKRLIQKNENRVAIEYLLLFSSMIRNVLDLSDKKSVTLREELEFSHQYLKMEKLRFRKNFEYEIYAGDENFLDEYNLPTMILQPHLENAIWHGIMPLEDRKGRVWINVFENEEFVVIHIEDNGIGRLASEEINARQRAHIHKSKGQSLSIDRLRLASLAREQEITTEIIDKDPDGENPGTIVKIKIKK